MSQVEVKVNLSISQEKALEFATRLARDDGFRKRAATRPLGLLEEYGITIEGGETLDFSPLIPPKHVVEEALVNVREASEFASLDGFESADPFAFWIFVIFLAT
jgi:hypothetical protein